ncbi:MAG TPA: HTTM domain-containing protein [Chthoniobacterales bacterium]|nr:HTTM domain-containing protein [Chthoniobacterales bacterium]
MSGAKSFSAEVRRRAFQPVDNATLIFFRVAFGALMFWEVTRYFSDGWIAHYWIKPRFFFTYYGFSWVHPWPGYGMYIHWAILGLLALFVAAGFLYRLSVALFFLGFTYSFLLDQTNYLNHFYFICLLSFLLIFLPANRALAIDAGMRPALHSETAPAWTLWLLRAQVGVVYFFAGIAKLSPDWLRGETARAFLSQDGQLMLTIPLIRAEWMPCLLTYGGLLFDLLIVPALLWRRTRIAAFGVAVIFHLLNARLFSIGVFPWLSIAATTLFLSPSWPRKLAAVILPARASAVPAKTPPPSERKQMIILSLAGLYVVVQLLVPLRQFLYPGSTDWTYQGHRFSWRMLLLDRFATSEFFVTDPNAGTTARIDPAQFLTPRQVSRMGPRPDMVLQFAHYLAAVLPRAGPKPLQVRARVLVSLNDREPQLLVDPNVDLAAEKRSLRPAKWILPRSTNDVK